MALLRGVARRRASALWWAVLAMRGVLPPLIGVLAGWLIAAIVERGSLAAPLVALAVAFVLAQVVGPLHEAIGYDLGERLSTDLNDQLLAITTAPHGIAHLERADLAADLSMARDFDLGITGPPLAISMNFIGDGLVLAVMGVVSAVVLAASSWWQALALTAVWASTHWILRESGVWHDRQTPEVKRAQKEADYSFRLAADPPAAKEVRLFGLGRWIVERFVAQRRRLYDLQFEATRLREKNTLGALVLVLGVNAVVFWTIAQRAQDGSLSLAATLVAAQAALGVSGVAFGGLSWALDGASAPVMAIRRLAGSMPEAGALGARRAAPTERSEPVDRARPGTVRSGPELRFEGVSFAYPGGPPVLDGLDLTIPAGRSLAIVGQNGAGKTTLAKLICRLYDPTGGQILVGGAPLPSLPLDAWRTRLAAVFQDFVRFELTLRENVTARLGDGGDDDDDVRQALADAGAAGLADLDTVLAKAYPGGIDLSGGQWQRVALARALFRVRRGADVVVLDEPTAQLDVRGETEIFERLLGATRGCTTILVSHRFSTVRRADRICVVEHGAVVEQGTHDELIALDGRYRTMFELQASRFTEVDEAGEEVVHELLD